MPEKAYIGLGSNLGDRQAYLTGGLQALGDLPGTRIEALSSLFETPPAGYLDQPFFLNAAAALQTSIPPEELLQAMQVIEASHHRQRTLPWGPRTLDLDLLLYGNRILCTHTLILPHPRLTERCFVLAPLGEIEPDLRHPCTGQRLMDYYQALNCNRQVRRLGKVRLNT